MVRTSGARPTKCHCGVLSQFLCDWITGKETTCDAHLCPEHAHPVGEGKHLCPEHQKSFAKWQAARATPAALPKK